MSEIYHVYAMKSEKDGRIYVGMAKDVEIRVVQHNKGKSKSTKGYRPWRLIYSEPAGARLQARVREKYLKSGVGKEFLKALEK